jgi:hypothetical protein
VVWQLGQRYQDFIDGRSIPFGEEGLLHEHELVTAPVDSSTWQQAGDRYNINTIILQLDTTEIDFAQLQDLCYSKSWRPVYLDEVSVVLVRQKPETEELINRLQINCATAPVPTQPLDHSARAFQLWANAAYVLAALRRTNEALSAADNAYRIFPSSAALRWVRGNALYASDRRVEAEQDWLAAMVATGGTIRSAGSNSGGPARVAANCPDDARCAREDKSAGETGSTVPPDAAA